jgi:exo-beta-1,3-glucanase (GH17 family)
MANFISSAKIASVLSITLALGACDQTSPYFETVSVTSEAAQTAGNRCDATQLQEFIGQPKSAVERADLGRPVRFIAAGEFVTESNDPTRANFFLNGDEVVSNVRCG